MNADVRAISKVTMADSETSDGLVGSALKSVFTF